MTIQLQSTFYLYLIMGILGASALSITPLCCTCLEELSFPVPESLSINFMFFTSNLFSLAISYLVTLPATGLAGTWILVGTLAPFYIYLMFWYKTDFFKSQHEGVYSSFNHPPEKIENLVPKEDTVLDPPTADTRQNNKEHDVIDQDTTQVDIGDIEKIKLI